MTPQISAAAASILLAASAVSAGPVEKSHLERVFTAEGPEVLSVAFDRDGRLLAAGGVGREIRVFDVESGALVRTLKGHDAGVSSLVFDPRGEFLFSGSYDASVLFWRLSDWSSALKLKDHLFGVSAIAVTSDGRVLASATAPGAVQLWRTRDGAKMRTFSSPRGALAAAFSSTGKLLVTGSGKEVAPGPRVGDLNRLQLWRVEDGGHLTDLSGPSKPVGTVAFSPDNSLIAGGGEDGLVRFWRVRDGRPAGVLKDHEGPIRSLAFSPDGRLLATGSDDSSIRLWRVQGLRPLCSFRDHAGPVRAVAFDPAGRRVVSAGSDGAVKLWGLKDSLKSYADARRWIKREDFKRAREGLQAFVSEWPCSLNADAARREIADITKYEGHYQAAETFFSTGDLGAAKKELLAARRIFKTKEAAKDLGDVNSRAAAARRTRVKARRDALIETSRAAMGRGGLAEAEKAAREAVAVEDGEQSRAQLDLVLAKSAEFQALLGEAQEASAMSQFQRAADVLRRAAAISEAPEVLAALREVQSLETERIEAVKRAEEEARRIEREKEEDARRLREERELAAQRAAHAKAGFTLAGITFFALLLAVSRRRTAAGGILIAGAAVLVLATTGFFLWFNKTYPAKTGGASASAAAK